MASLSKNKTNTRWKKIENNKINSTGMDNKKK